MRIKLAIVDDHQPFREGIKRIVSSTNVEVVMDASSGIDFIRQLSTLNEEMKPDVVFLDSRMPDMDGYQTVRWLKMERPNMKILMFSMFDNYEMVLQFLKMGVHGFISKNSEPSILASALNMVMEKGFYYSEFIAEKVMESLRSRKVGFPPELPTAQIKEITESLTKTQLIFIKHACSGLRYHEIAEKMSISPRTVDVHRSNVFKKFNVNSIVNLVVIALKYGIVDME